MEAAGGRVGDISVRGAVEDDGRDERGAAGLTRGCNAARRPAGDVAEGRRGRLYCVLIVIMLELQGTNLSSTLFMMIIPR